MTEIKLNYFKNRDLSFDIAKGMGIFLMVIGHTSIPKFVSSWIYSFHMPLFFIISGIFYNPVKYPSFLSFLIAKSRSLLIPYILYLLVSELLELTCDTDNVTLWFLPVLFVSEIVFYIINKLTTKIRYKQQLCIFIVTLLALIGYKLSLSGVRIPFDMQNVGHALIYYTFGYYFNKWLKKISTTLWKVILMIVSYTIVVLFVPNLDMLSNNWGIFIISQILAIVGTIIIILSARIICTWNDRNPLLSFFKWAGRNSIILVGFSIPFITVCNKVGGYFIEDTHTIWFSVIKHIAMWITMYYLSGFFLKYAPWVMGKYSSSISPKY